MSAQAQPRPAPRAAAQLGNERARLIRLVHVGRRELKLGEEDYRQLLLSEGGADSSAAMSVGQLQRVVDYMKRNGFKVATKAKAARPARSRSTGRQNGMEPAVHLASDPESRKARAMWLTLHAIGQVRDPSEAALLAYVLRQSKVERMEWVRDMVPVLESLKAWLLRSMPAVVLPYLKEPASVWAAHMDAIWHENWDRAVGHLRYGIQSGHVQLVDQWVDLWQLVVLQNQHVGREQ